MLEDAIFSNKMFLGSLLSLKNSVVNRKKKQKKSWLIVVTFFAFCTSYAQSVPLHFHQLTLSDNLTSQNYNWYIQKDTHEWVWISSVDGLNRYDGLNIKQYKANRQDSATIYDNIVLSHFFEDNDKNFWYSTMGGLQYYQRNLDKFHYYPIFNDEKEKQGACYLLHRDSNNEDLWVRVERQLYGIPKGEPHKAQLIGDYSLGISSRLMKSSKKMNHYFLFKPIAKGLVLYQFKPFYQISKPDTLFKEYTIQTISFINDNNIWLGVENGLILYDLENKEYKIYIDSNTIKIKKVTGIELLDSNRLIVASLEKGIFYFNLITESFSGPLLQIDAIESKPFLQIIDRIYLDKDKTLWISTKGNGVFYTSLKKKKISFFSRNEKEEPIKDNYIKSITEDQDSQLVFLTNKGIRKASIENSNSNIKLKNKLNIQLEQPFHLHYDKDQTFWVCSLSGLYYQKKEQDNFYKVPTQNLSFSSNLVFYYFNSLRNGQKLTASSRGVLQWNTREKKLQIIPGLEHETLSFKFIVENIEKQQVILRKIQHSFLIGHFWKNSFILDTTLNFTPYINHIYHDNLKHKYWLATSEGLYSLIYNINQYKIEKDPLVTEKLMGVLKQDESNNLWLSSNRVIIQYNYQTGKKRVYGIEDGIQSLEFNPGAAYKSKSGKLMFGGVNGLNIFDPKTIIDDAKPVNPTITSILINDEPPKEKLICSTTGNQNISYIEQLDLSFDKNTLSFNFAALDYVNPDANQFRYRMKGQEDKWVFSGTKNFARYANLPPNSYIFEVDATNSDGIWSEKPAQLRITIHPPWYQTWYAYVGYILSSILLFIGFYRFQINQRLKQAEAHRLKELDRIKTALYANITHEFRTPLTIILGMADQIKNRQQKGFHKSLEMIRRSGQNLLNLVNQMLDLSKVESGNLQAQYVQGDIVHYLQYLVEAFQSFAESKKISIVFYNEVADLMMDYDVDKLQTIVTNLLSNATKFTPEKGKIIVHIRQITKEEKSFCQIKIKDNGIGIDEKELPHIFDRFYQVDDTATRHSGGTGIGLALTKELVELMNGTISAQSQLNKGTEFTILLPIFKTAPFAKDFSRENFIKKLDKEVENKTELESSEINQNLPSILIIEDNLDVITYLQSCLEDQYQINIALDGQLGIEKALEIIPDIIISDVMMPYKDGFEVCEFLKQEEKTSHIPIIILTAKAQIEAKIEGLSKGADAYLSKPFHKKELEVRLSQLLEQRNRLQAYYSQETITTYPKIEDPFIQKVIELVESDLSTNLDLETFSQSLAMSRTQVYRKIKAMTGESTSIFIRRIRLKNAHHLLLTTSLSVSEIAYSVGFKDPSFFSRSFSAIYKKSPTQLREEQEKP